MKGKIKFYNRKQDFGFVIGADGQEYYFNASSIAPLKEHDSVSFVIEDSPRGKTAKRIQHQAPRATLPIGAMLILGMVIGLLVGYLMH